MDDFIIHSDDVIQHFGVKGMKWGKRLRDNHIQNLEYKYRKLGYNEEQVKQKLAKRLRNEKIALGAVGAAGAAVAGYMLKNKIQDDFIGRTLKKGKTFDSVNAASKIDTSRPVYGAYRKNDKKYSGYRTKNPTIFFDHKNLKVASKKILSNDTIEKDYDKTMKILSVQNNAGKVAGFSTAVAGLAAYSSHRNNNDVRKNDEEYNKKYGKKVRK